MRNRAPLLLVLLVATLASAGRAVAATPAAERDARRAFASGETHFRAGRYAEALGEYQAGYDAAPLPGFLINIAQCQRRLGDLSKARATYQKFVIVAPDSPHVPEVKALIGELDKLLAEPDGEGAKTASAEGEARPEVASPPAAPVPAAIEPAPSARPPALAFAAPPPSEAGRKKAAPRRWWLWGIAGTVVVGVGATLAGIALASPATTTLHDGTLGTLRR